MSYKIPKTMGTVVDHYLAARDARLALQKQVDELKQKEDLLKNHIIDTLPKSKLEGAKGKLGSVAVYTDDIPIVEDETKFRQYLGRHKRHDLAQKLKPSVSAVREMWEAGKSVPGIKKFKVVKLSISRK